MREDVLSEIVRILEARYYFSERVYYHHAKIAAGALVAKAVEYAIVSGAAQESDFHRQTDESMIAFLERLDYDGGELRSRAQRLLARLRTRKLMKRCGVYPLSSNQGVQQALLERFFSKGCHAERLAVERRLEARAKAKLGREVDVMIYVPARRMQLKEARIHVRFPGSSELRPLSEFSAQVPRLLDLETAYRNLWKFYVLISESEPGAIAAIQELLPDEFQGAVNVYSPGAAPSP